MSRCQLEIEPFLADAQVEVKKGETDGAVGLDEEIEQRTQYGLNRVIAKIGKHSGPELSRHNFVGRQDTFEQTNSHAENDQNEEKQHEHPEHPPAIAARQLLAASQGGVSLQSFHDDHLADEDVPDGEEESRHKAKETAQHNEQTREKRSQKESSETVQGESESVSHAGTLINELLSDDVQNGRGSDRLKDKRQERCHEVAYNQLHLRLISSQRLAHFHQRDR